MKYGIRIIGEEVGLPFGIRNTREEVDAILSRIMPRMPYGNLEVYEIPEKPKKSIVIENEVQIAWKDRPDVPGLYFWKGTGGSKGIEIWDEKAIKECLHFGRYYGPIPEDK